MPKVPFPPIRLVNALCITHMKRLEHFLQTVVAAGNCNEVDVVGHEAVGEYFDLVFLAVFQQPRQVGRAIVVSEEDVFSTIPALRDVVWHSRKYRSGKSWHFRKVA